MCFSRVLRIAAIKTIGSRMEMFCPFWLAYTASFALKSPDRNLDMVNADSVSLCPIVSPFPTLAQTTDLMPPEIPAEHL